MLFNDQELDRIAHARKDWAEGPLQRQLDRFGMETPPGRTYTPADLPDWDFMDKVGLPGQYPFTSMEYPTHVPDQPGGGSAVRFVAGAYAGYGTVEDTRDLWRSQGRRGANVAFDLPTQCGYDSDDPIARGEVGKVGCAVDSLRDFEVLFEFLDGVAPLDQTANNFTINAPCNIILAMYIALAEKKGIDPAKLRGTPQNDILKEFVARGTWIFPPDPSMRMVRDTMTYCARNMPLLNPISICGYHIREAGATAAQTMAFTFSNAIAYVQMGIDAGLDIDTFIRNFTFLNFSGSMDFFLEIARARAARRMWARIMKERFGAKDPRSWIISGLGTATDGRYCTTTQRPLNNLTRGVVMGVAAALSGGRPTGGVPWDEPLGLGHSYEASQLSIDAARIMRYEAGLGDVIDPLAGSYYVESLTDRIEAETLEIMDRIAEMGGSVEAIKSGWMQREVARSAYRFHKEVETGERVIVGVNRFTGDGELEVTTSRLAPHPYDPQKRADAEERQLASLAEVKRQRDDGVVQSTLKALRKAAAVESENLVPYFLDCVKAYATVGEMCNVLRDVFGEWQPVGAM
ncbi:MAG: methylmalonyl-CoA mutase family protein [Dehalococcoidales bacterium]